MIKKESLSFLQDLKDNNNREWFAENKKRFEKEQKDIKEFFNEIGNSLGKFDNIENIQIFRIYRDVRFSKNKLPYKVNFSAGYKRTKPMLRGGYYLHIQNDASFVGGGFWEPNKEDLLRIRKEIELDASELREIISQDSFKKYFGSLQGDELKTAPRDFDKNHPDIDLIRKKQFLVTRSFSNKEVLSPNFNEEVLVTFKAMRPFFDYMSDVLTTNLNGESII
ncbi:DUF2461 domain-containing protein [Flavobacterium jejuense]|uniref:DUF2461 domain-containing protein n=1 Tax=Flavobacterium jejuense TaxID=1544455 RepID=A0ABX0ISP8_9FLAO|nr:DUF2461 domain-containing protein [Flavobacterium jejuense]NHN25857.1 DUF2461 domain-containing protein [Flavobacterium jejuense]